MTLWSRLFNRPANAPRAAVQQDGGGTLITTAAELEDFINGGASGGPMTAEKAMRDVSVYACVRIISAPVATLPLDIKRRVDARTREDASDTKLGILLRRRPNSWQKPAQFRRMLQAHVLLRGNAYCHIVRSRGEIIALIPLHPDRVEPKQIADLSIVYEYRRPDGGLTTFKQSEIWHLFGLTLDGIKGVTPITYARETIGLSLAMESHGVKTFKNGLRVGGVLEHPETLGKEARENLRASLEQYRAGGASEDRWLILEEGMKPSELKMTLQDAQWIESRKLSRSDIAMLFGVPPHMIGLTEKSTSWGSGIEQQKDGFVTFTLDDHLVMWEEGITIDLADDPKLYAKFNRNALVKGNIKDRWDAYVKALQWGVYNPDKVLALEDENPREDGQGGKYYDPPNTAGATDKPDDGDKPPKEPGDDDPQDA